MKNRRRIKKYTAYLLVFIMGLSLMNPKSLLAAQENVLYLSTVEDLMAFSAKCILDSWSKDKQVILKNDIDLNGIAFKPIPIFSGNFDGKGHTISGLYLNEKGSQQGLFRYIEEGAIVKNLNVVGKVIPDGSKTYLGGIAGKNRGTLSQCTFSGTVDGAHYVGGLVGTNEATGKLVDCKVDGIIDGKSAIGGLAGENLGIIVQCTNKAKVNTKVIETQHIEMEELMKGEVTPIWEEEDTSEITNIGGITGVNTGIIQNCTNKGTIGYCHVGYNVGGIAGIQSGYITECHNTGIVYGRKEVGGIVGQMEPYTRLKFSESQLKRMEKELDKLQSLIRQATENSHDSSDTVSKQLTTIGDYTEEAKTQTKDLLNQTQSLVDENIEEVNKVSATVSEVLDRLVPITDALEQMGSYIEESLKPMEDAMKALSRANVHLGEGFESGEALARRLASTIDYSDNALLNFNEGIANVRIAMDCLMSSNLRGTIYYIREAIACVEQSSDNIHMSLSELKEVSKQLEEMFEATGEANQDMNSALKSLTEMIESLEDVASALSDALEEINNLAQYLAEQPEVHFVTTDSTYEETKDKLSDVLDSTSSALSELNQMVNDKSHILLDDIQAISDQFFVVFDVVLDITKEINNYETDPEKRKEDISKQDREEEKEGKVVACTNKGNIEGDINVGGIAGAIGIERSFDPEDDLEINGDKSLDFIFQTRAVIRDCQSDGEIKAKKDSVGGIVGNMKLGYVVRSQAEGKIISSDGNYVGGIAGDTQGSIHSSYAKCTLEGGKYIGGIAGRGKELIDCGSYVQVKTGNEYIGAIAGEIQNEGEVKGNFFVEGSYGGINGISYKGKAEPMDYKTFVSLEEVPDIFSNIKARFWIEDELVDTLMIPYGAQLEQEQLPSIPSKEGYYVEWENFDTNPLSFDQDIKATYKAYRTTLESKERRNETIPILLVEGQFSELDQLEVIKSEHPSPTLTENQTQLEQWKITIPQDGKPSHTLRYLLPAKAQHMTMYLLNDEQWVQLETTKDGKYILFEVEGNQATISAICSQEPEALTPILVLISSILGIVILISINKKSKGKKLEEQNEISG